MQNKQRKFDSETKKLRSHLVVKLNNEENKFKIQMSKDFDVLKKQIHLHENDIKQIQNLTTKKALEVGENKGELYRLKSTLKNQNEIIQKSKSLKAALPLAANLTKNEKMETKSQFTNTARVRGKLYLF